jgi:hypothetical protein
MYFDRVTLDAIHERSETSLALYFVRQNKFEYIHTGNIWLEKHDNIYLAKGSKAPVSMQLSLRRILVKLVDSSDTNMQEIMLSHRMQIYGGNSDIKLREELDIAKTLSESIGKLRQRIASSLFLTRVLKEAKLYLTIELTKEEVACLLTSSCPIEQWVVLMLRPCPSSKTRASDILSAFHKETGSTNITAASMGRAIRKVYNQGSRSIDKVRVYGLHFRQRESL